MRRDDIVDGYLLVRQSKTEKKLRIQVESDGEPNSLGTRIERITGAMPSSCLPSWSSTGAANACRGRCCETAGTMPESQLPP